MTTLDLSQILLRTGSPTMAAIRALESSGFKIVLVVDDENRLLGSITDGDVRRAVLKGVAMTATVEQIMRSRPFTAPHTVSDDIALALMRQNAIKHLPLLDEQGRVVAVKTLDALLGAASRPNWVIVMAGGQGTRLRPLTSSIPKPMLDVGSKPLLETTIDNFVRIGFRNFFISVNYCADVVKTHFGDGESLGARIDYLEEEAFLGTAGGLRLLPSRPEHPVIVMNGDILTAVDFMELLRFHDAHGGLGTMCVREYELKIPYGVVEFSGSTLTALVEKPSNRCFVNAGVYVLSPAALDFLPAEGPYAMTELFQSMIAAGQSPCVFPIREYWMDIGRIADLERARREFSAFFS